MFILYFFALELELNCLINSKNKMSDSSVSHDEEEIINDIENIESNLVITAEYPQEQKDKHESEFQK